MAKLPEYVKTTEKKEGRFENPSLKVTYKIEEGGTIDNIETVVFKKKEFQVVTLVGKQQPHYKTSGEVKAYVTPSTYTDEIGGKGYNKVLKKFEEGFDYTGFVLSGVWREDPFRKRGKEGVLELIDII